MAQGLLRKQKNALVLAFGIALVASVALLGRHSGRSSFVPAPGAPLGGEAASRRAGVLGAPAALMAAAAAFENIDPAFAEKMGEMDPKMPEVDVPERIASDPYELLSLNPDDSRADKREFYMKRAYRDDTYQVIKHMKISGSLDKGTPNMERFNNRVKEEMDDWMALYRRQDAVVGRQSYYALRSSVNALASHFTSYGPRFPFPNKRRPRFYQKIYLSEKYLEKGK